MPTVITSSFRLRDFPAGRRSGRRHRYPPRSSIPRPVASWPAGSPLPAPNGKQESCIYRFVFRSDPTRKRTCLYYYNN